MQTETTLDESPKVDEMNAPKQDKQKAHIIRRNVEDYLEQKALERRLTEVFDEDYGLTW